uniref:60S ribosomal protein L29 n=1 Tax=Steinernema glaseri TaxID=37863 RepID=A0A1I7XYZ3_9BILA
MGCKAAARPKSAKRRRILPKAVSKPRTSVGGTLMGKCRINDKQPNYKQMPLLKMLKDNKRTQHFAPEQRLAAQKKSWRQRHVSKEYRDV